MTLPTSQWTAAERIHAAGGTPSDVIPGCKFRGTEIDGTNFRFFNDITSAGYDNSSYDGSILGYDYRNLDLEALYDAVINGTNFVNLPEEVEKVIIDGGAFYQPLLSENRPPELSSIRFGDTMSFDVTTFPFNVLNDYGYDAQGYDFEVNENGDRVGYDFIPTDNLAFIRRPRIRQDLYIANGGSRFAINNIPQSNDAVMVYVDGILDTNYTITWTNNRPVVFFNTAPSIGSKIKIVSFSTGGVTNIIYEKFVKFNTNTFDTGINIISGYGVFATINGEYVETQTLKDGFTDLTLTQIRIPSANMGDDVYLVIYDSPLSSLVFNENFNFTGTVQTVNISRPLNPPEVYTTVYKNGNRLVPAYIRYFDPVVPTSTFYLNEEIYDPSLLVIYVDKIFRNDYTVNQLKKTITFNSPIVSGSEVLIVNRSISEFSFNNTELTIHTVATSRNVIPNVAIGQSLDINGIVTTFSRPDNTGTIPMNVDVGQYVIQGSTITDPDIVNGITPFGANETLVINGKTISVSSTDTIPEIISKINAVSDDTMVTSRIENNRLTILSGGHNISLIGNWSVFGIVSGQYENIVKQLQDSMGSDYRILTLDGNIRVIYIQPQPITVNFTQLSFNLGFDNFVSNDGARISVTTMDENTSFTMRTEVFEGSFTGEYPITKKGFNDYSTQVSVLGKDAINLSDFVIKPIDFGFDLNGYRGYDYSGVGLEFNTPHLQEQTVIITTFNSSPRDLQNRAKIFKGLNNTFEAYRITEDNIMEIVQDAPFGTDHIVVSDINKVGMPNKEKNIPGYIWVDGEMIGYYDIDATDPNRVKLMKLVRGAKGTPFGKNIVAGQEVLDLTNTKINIKDATQYLLS